MYVYIYIYIYIYSYMVHICNLSESVLIIEVSSYQDLVFFLNFIIALYFSIKDRHIYYTCVVAFFRRRTK